MILPLSVSVSVSYLFYMYNAQTREHVCDTIPMHIPCPIVVMRHARSRSLCIITAACNVLLLVFRLWTDEKTHEVADEVKFDDGTECAPRQQRPTDRRRWNRI